ncbi:MAG: DUF1501 domain-containing protein [Planctomycetales bacterium]
MLDVLDQSFDRRSHRLRDGVSRRKFLKIGGMALGGMALPDLLRLRAAGNAAASPVRLPKSVIMVYLFGGPSHIDTYDLKPEAPVDYRGEFQPIRTNVPGFDICELMPMQARIADRLALIRNMKFNPNFHDPVEWLSGFRKPTESTPAARPDLGSVISKLQSEDGPGELPTYVALDKMVGGARLNGPAYLGMAHKPFVPGDKYETMALARGITPDRLRDRRTLLDEFDQFRRAAEDPRGEMGTMDAFTAQALSMIVSPRARDAFDVEREPEGVRAKYGTGEALRFLRARRLVEAGVPVVTLTFGQSGATAACRFGWDTHEANFTCLRDILPRLDRAIHALITDLAERGMDRDVLVVIGGEMGRTPRVGQSTGNGAKTDGRDHWVQAGFTLVSGGGLRMGQVIGQTDKRASLPVGVPYTPQNVLATIYRVLGIDPAQTTLSDHTGRPIHLLDDPRPIKELL